MAEDRDQLEEMSSTQHAIWSHWMKYMYSRMQVDEVNHKSGLMTVTMSYDDYCRWQRQMETDYADLPEHEKDSDRQIVKGFILKEGWPS